MRHWSTDTRAETTKCSIRQSRQNDRTVSGKGGTPVARRAPERNHSCLLVTHTCDTGGNRGIPASADIERTPASMASSSGTGNRPAHHVNTAVSTERSEAAPDFSIHCRPSSRVSRKTVAPDFPMTIGGSC
jgi:hypothetical protein